MGQNWITSFIYTIIAFLTAMPLVRKIKPELLLVNGPGTCVPIVIATWLCRLLKIIPQTKIVFVESICRVKTLSMSAKILRYFVDSIIVQWPELSLNYTETNYIGKFS